MLGALAIYVVLAARRRQRGAGTMALGVARTLPGSPDRC